jgi:transposase
MERLTMSSQEIQRLELMRQLSDRTLTQGQVGEILGISERQVRRLQRRYEASGAAGLISGHRGKPSNRRYDQAIKQAILASVKQRYSDFGPTLAAEYLLEEGYEVSKETLRQWMVADGLWKPSHKRRKRLHPPRDRRSRTGELIQIDGSPHDWFEGRADKCCLIAFIDDATSQVMHAHFAPAETTQAYFRALNAYVKQYGCPAAFYSDRHIIFAKHDKEDEEPTQFQRGIEQLGIEGIQALTAQAKGRIERLFQTLQDRLVKAMRLAGVDGMESGNEFLATYIPKHNKRFAVASADPADAHQPSDLTPTQLDQVCAAHHERKLSKDLVVSFNRQRYIIQTDGAPRYDLRGQKVIVIEHADKPIELMHKGKLLPFKAFDPKQEIPFPVDDKTLNTRVDNIIQRRRGPAKRKPVQTDPWSSARKGASSGAGHMASP